CAPGQTAAVVYGGVTPGGSGGMMFASAGATTRAAVHEVFDPIAGEMASLTQVSLADPAMQAFERTGRLEVVGDAGRFVMPAGRDERAAVRRFFQHCGSARA
ncbi:MAG TPA: hypothetical protein VGB49_03830, partial [Caulobacteraceae bacterium]